MQIKEKRKEYNLTQDEFGKLVGVSRQTIVNWENGSTIPESKLDFMRTLFDKLDNGDSTDLAQLYKGHVKEPGDKYKTTEDKERYIQSLERIIISKDEQIKAMQDSIVFLKSLVERKTE